MMPPSPSQSLPLRAGFVEALAAVEAEMLAIRRTIAAVCGVSVSSTYVLTELARRGGHAHPRDIAAALYLSSGTTTSMLDRLEQVGLVCRAADEDDRRSVLITLSPAGRRVLDDARDHFGDIIDEVLSPVVAAGLASSLTQLARELHAGRSAGGK